jgi:flagellar motility protein MotE (MotC chaperone)
MKGLLSVKNLIIIFGSLVVVNVAMFFILKATQPKSAVPELLAAGEIADSTVHAEHDSTLTGRQETLTENSDDSSSHDEHSDDITNIASAPLDTQETISEAAHEIDTSHSTPTEETVAEQSEEQLAQLTEAVSQGDIKEFQRLAKLLQAMKPIEAAPIMAHLSDETIVAIFMRMRERSAAKIMSLLSIERSVEISRLMTRMVDQASR